MTGRVWHFGQFSAWVIEVGGTPWLVRFPRKGEPDRRIVRHILHVTPSWDAEPEGVARLVRHLAGCQGAGRPTAKELLSLSTDVVEMAQRLAAGERAYGADPYFRGMPELGWWRNSEQPDAVLARRERELAAQSPERVSLARREGERDRHRVS